MKNTAAILTIVASTAGAYEVTQGTAQASDPLVIAGDLSWDQHGFRFFCVPSHYSYDDPVVYPNQEGAAHLHMFFGNTDVNYASTSESVINSGRSTCDGGITNRSAYWVPALYDDAGFVVLPSYLNLYYKSHITGTARAAMNPVPQGLQVLANNQVQGYQDSHIDTLDHDGLTMIVVFPDCLAIDAQGQPLLTSPGGAAHVAYSSGNCPASHPYAIPQLTQIINWSDIDYNSEWRLASDLMHDAPKGSTAHADYIAGWTEAAAITMRDCVRDLFSACGPQMHTFYDERAYNSAGVQVYDYFSVHATASDTPLHSDDWPAMRSNAGACSE